MTSISVIAGNIPLALALEPGSSTRSSLGIVVIGGITSSLVLTLVLVPIMYALLAPEHFAPSHGGRERAEGGSGGTATVTPAATATRSPEPLSPHTLKIAESRSIRLLRRLPAS